LRDLVCDRSMTPRSMRRVTPGRISRALRVSTSTGASRTVLREPFDAHARR